MICSRRDQLQGEKGWYGTRWPRLSKDEKQQFQRWGNMSNNFEATFKYSNGQIRDVRDELIVAREIVCHVDADLSILKKQIQPEERRGMPELEREISVLTLVLEDASKDNPCQISETKRAYSHKGCLCWKRSACPEISRPMFERWSSLLS